MDGQKNNIPFFYLSIHFSGAEQNIICENMFFFCTFFPTSLVLNCNCTLLWNYFLFNHLSVPQMASYSLYSPLWAWSKVVHYVGNRVPFGKHVILTLWAVVFLPVDWPLTASRRPKTWGSTECEQFPESCCWGSLAVWLSLSDCLAVCKAVILGSAWFSLSSH
jgi:hypothetical protein